jgi:hypothetical protein
MIPVGCTLYLKPSAQKYSAYRDARSGLDDFRKLYRLQFVRTGLPGVSTSRQFRCKYFRGGALLVEWSRLPTSVRRDIRSAKRNGDKNLSALWRR